VAEERKVSEHYAAIAKAWIDSRDEFEHLKDASIIYLESDHRKKSKRKKVFGLCEKVQDKNKWAIPADFTITFYRPHMEKLSEWQQEIVVYHELLHVGFYGEDEPMQTIPHDMEDFRQVIDMFGSHWDEDGADLLNTALLIEISEDASYLEESENSKGGEE
jgi:hypothetical protein